MYLETYWNVCLLEHIEFLFSSRRNMESNYHLVSFPVTWDNKINQKSITKLAEAVNFVILRTTLCVIVSVTFYNLIFINIIFLYIISNIGILSGNQWYYYSNIDGSLCCNCDWKYSRKMNVKMQLAFTKYQVRRTINGRL